MAIRITAGRSGSLYCISIQLICVLPALRWTVMANSGPQKTEVVALISAVVQDVEPLLG